MLNNPAWMAFTAEAIAAQEELTGDDALLSDWLLWLTRKRTIVIPWGGDVYDEAPRAFERSTGRSLTYLQREEITGFFIFLDSGDCINRADTDVDDVETIWFNTYGIKSTPTKSAAEVYANILVTDYREEQVRNGAFR